MKASRIVITSLLFALLSSNAFWAYTTLDSGVTATYQEVTLRENREALDQILAVVPVLTKKDSSKAEILNAAKHPYLTNEPFKKDGAIWVGRLGFVFTEQNHLIEVRKAWQ